MASSRMLALLGLLAVAGYQNRDRLGEMFGKITGTKDDHAPKGQEKSVPTSQSGGMMGNILGGLLSTANARDIPGGLGDLIEQFTGAGQGDAAKSWVQTGPNRKIETSELESALGEDTIDALVRQTGLSRTELLSRLKSALPDAVNDLTPDGRLPSETEVAQWSR